MKNSYHYLKPNAMKNLIQQCLFLLVFLSIAVQVSAQCNPDIEAPTSVCKLGLVVEIMAPANNVEIWATDFDDGSYDNCSSAQQLSFFLEETPVSGTHPSSSNIIYDMDDIGQHNVVMWVVDAAGNENYCTATLTIHAPCPGGPAQTLVCNSQVIVNVPVGETLNFYPGAMLEGNNYCSDYTIRKANEPFAPFLALTSAEEGTHVITVRDVNTNAACWGELVVAVGDCNNDVVLPTPHCVSNLNVTVAPGGTTVQATEINTGSYDNCTPSNLLDFRLEKAPVSNQPPSTTSVTYQEMDLGVDTVALWVIDTAGNANFCIASITVDTACTGTTNLACNDNITIEINSPNPVDFYPADMLEGGPYCLNQMVIGHALFGTPQPFLSFTYQDAGTHTLQVTHLPSGNSCWGNVEITTNCIGESVPPTPVCYQNKTVQLSLDGPDLTIFHAIEVNAGSFDNCSSPSDLNFAIETGPASPTMPSSTSIEFTAVGTYSGVVMWVADEAGNTNSCTVDVTVIPPKCNPDVTAPALVPPADTTISSDDLAAMNLDTQNYLQLDQFFGTAYAWDACGLDTLIQAAEFVNNACGNLRTLTRTFWAIDDAGNSTTAQQIIHVNYDFSINIPKDYLPGDSGDPEELTVVQGNGTLLSINYQDVLLEFNCDTIPDKIIRTWGVLNWCEANSNSIPTNLPRLDRNADGNDGDAYVAWVLPDSVYLLENGLPIQNLSANTYNLFNYKQIIRYNYDDTLFTAIAGQVFIDTSANCTYETGEPGLSNWKVKAVGQTTGRVYTTTSTANGVYQINGICPIDTQLELSLDVPFNYGQNCATTWMVNTIPNMPAVQNIPVQLDDDCNLLEVNLSTPFLRRCFPNHYWVNYCNYSAQTIPNVYVEVKLDSFMDFTSSTIPGTSLGSNLFSFQLDSLAPGQCGSFSIFFDLNCDAELNQTHCTEAHIFPDTLCPVSPSWSGANIEVEGHCENDEVHLSIKNSGTGNMTAPLDFIVVEDVVMYMSSNFNLGAGQTLQLPIIASNGETWRLEAEQVPDHPYPGNVSVTLEGCNGINMTGLVNLFPTENPNPFIAVDCQENIGAFDPNDKSANPVGYGNDHYISRNTDIEYLVRFQNTGTDTAFNVVILDTLSEYLDPATIRPGASSHHFSFEVLDGNVLRFTFPEIMLPDSNVNEAASHGFVQFVAKQKPAVALETVIENTANIYFDFNEPVKTNTVYHTIGEDFIEIMSDASETIGHGQPKVFPNPAFGAVTFALPVDLGENASFTLHDKLGKLIRSEQFSGNQFRFERKDMAPGIYFYAIEKEGTKYYSGKVILR
ncbi:MAG: T9SS type A sorting domain-containing protein [Bacteroidetes bacterium]|nr:T9SS type A sorting domain-containing protein [Bacteroidota bacterium]